MCVLFNKIRERSYFVRVQHNVGIPMFIFPLLDYFLVDEVPLKQFNQRLGLIRGQYYLWHWPAVFPDVLAQFRDWMIFTRMIAPGKTEGN